MSSIYYLLIYNCYIIILSQIIFYHPYLLYATILLHPSILTHLIHHFPYCCNSSIIQSPSSVSGIQTQSYTGGANRYAKVIFTPSASTDVGSVLLFVKDGAGGITTSDTTLSTYQHMNPTSNTYFDLQHANIGTIQVVQLALTSSATTLHVYVYNFETALTVTYSTTFSEYVSSDTTYCSAQGIVQATSIYCSSCLSSLYIGAFCSIQDGVIT